MYNYNMKTKICSRCHKEKSFTEFRKHACHSDGYASECKVCAKKRYWENREKEIARKRKYRMNLEVKKREREYCHLYNLKNTKRRVTYNKKYIELHPEWAKKKARESYYRHREERLISTSKYKKNHRDYYNEQERKRHNLKNNLPATLTKENWEEILKLYNYRCYYCNSLGTKSNPLEKEHKIPLIRGGGYTKENIVPACRNCNAKKHTLTDREFRLRLTCLTK